MGMVYKINYCQERLIDILTERNLNNTDLKINSRGPRTEPWGTPHIQEWQEEKLLLHLTRN